MANITDTQLIQRLNAAFPGRSATELYAILSPMLDDAQFLDDVTASAAEINRAADPDSAFEILTALDTLTIADHNKTFYLNSGTEFAVTLPAAADADGMHIRFFVKAAPSGASYTIVTAAAAQELGGKVFSAAGDAGDVENAATATTITFVDGQAVFGDTAELWCDGAAWYALCHASVAAGITITG
jgi:hypothetical protein